MSAAVSEMRHVVRAIMAAIAPHDALEHDHQTEVLRWVDSGVEIFRLAKPATPPRHLVSYFVVMDEAARKVLLVDHKKALLWLPSGGHVEPGEHPRLTVQRECLEELGVAADFWREEPLFITLTETVGLGAGHEDVSLWYVLRGDAAADYVYDADEFNGICWFDFDAIPFERADPHMQRFMQKLEREVLG